MPKSLDQNEWYFEECPTDEIEYCWTYEYARESQILRKLIMKWRRGAKGDQFEDYRVLARRLHVGPYGVCAYPFFPCWPNKPYLSIDRKIRKARLERLRMPWDPIDEMYTIEAQNWSEESTLRILERIAKSSPLSFRRGSMQYVVFNIDWDLHDGQLATMFDRWLKQNRPADAKAREMRGRGHPARKGRANLKYLSAYRLCKQMSKDDAIVFLEERGGKLKPYKNYQDWNLAISRAEAIIRTLEDDAFIDSDEESYDGGQSQTVSESV
jgi:hypothetical protein